MSGSVETSGAAIQGRTEAGRRQEVRTRVIIVARPVYSPSLYFQMIGRGLRGVKNGGNDRCLILNVRDNIENIATLEPVPHR